jgi:predicted small metal-binding protein
MTSDEQRTLGSNDPQHTRNGQMKGNPGDDMAAASQRASDSATTNKRPADTHNQSDLSQRTSGSANSMNNSQGGITQGGFTQRGTHTFRCSDAGNGNCAWETSGRSEEEVLQKVVEHTRDDHGMTDWSDAMHERVRGAIRHRKAA